MRQFVLAGILLLAGCGSRDSGTPYAPNPPAQKQTGPAGGASTGADGNVGGSDGATTGGTSSGTSTGSAGSTTAGGTATSGTTTGGASTTGGSTGGFDPRTWTPPSKGLWIWRFDYLNITADQAAAYAESLGIAWVLIKSGQDDYWNTRYTPEVVQSFTSRGIHVFAWPYMTPSNVSASIAGAVQAAQVAGTDGLVLDVEVEFQGTTASTYTPEAEAMCDGIRAGAPGVFLGYTSFGWVDDHDTFPYAAFDGHCGDAFFPQVYWSDFGVSEQTGYSHAIAAMQNAGLQAPVWMIQSNDSGTNGIPTPAQLNAFWTLSGPRSSLWALTDTTTTQYQDLASLAWSNAGTTPLFPPPNNARVAPSATGTAVVIDFSSAEATFATQLALLQNHAIDAQMLAWFRASLAPEVTVDAAALSACAARVVGNQVSPDWPMAKRSSGQVSVSVFGKSLTTFYDDGSGTYRAQRLWCR